MEFDDELQPHISYEVEDSEDAMGRSMAIHRLYVHNQGHLRHKILMLETFGKLGKSEILDLLDRAKQCVLSSDQDLPLEYLPY